MIIWLVNPVTGWRRALRVFLDSGATHSFIAMEWVSRLQLKHIGKCTVNIEALGETYTDQEVIVVEAQVCKNQQTSSSSTMKFLVWDKFVKSLACYKLTREQRRRMVSLNLKMADPEADSNGKLAVDVLIGQDFYHALQDGGELTLPGGLVLTKSVNGRYILGGTSIVPEEVKPESSELTAPSYTVTVLSSTENFNSLKPLEEQKTLDRFSNTDYLGTINTLQKELPAILERFNEETTHNGVRYKIRLPFKEFQYLQLSPNFIMAWNRFLSWYAKHQRKKDKTEYLKYCQIMKEQLDLGILEKVEKLGTIDEVQEKLKTDKHAFDKLKVTPGSRCVHYLPWHGVYKASTGKLRIVYDAQARPAKGAYSLNDTLETGPDLMNSLYQILLKFRGKRFACIADIEKAFLAIEIAEEDRDALRLLWIEDGVVWVVRFARLPFGLTCSPFILAAVIQKHLTSSDIDPDMVHAILTAFYMDDYVDSVDTFEDLMHRQALTVQEFAKGGMKLRQWSSNSPEAREHFKTLGDDPPDIQTVLGLKWDVNTDLISINTERIENLVGQQPKSKRKFWSFVAQVFDPLGLLTPYTVLAKLLTRQVSVACKGWDSKLPKELSEKVTKWMDDFLLIPTLTFPRHVSIVDPTLERLVCFCDASTKALGVCVYMVSTDAEGNVVSNLLTAKSKIAPFPAQTIPRSELAAAVLAVNVMSHVREAYPYIPMDRIYYFSDSRNVIFWIYSGSWSWPTFIANRRKTIVEGSEINQWAHVDTEENPADLPSRGCSLSDLRDSDLWKYGPKFLLQGMDCGKSTVDGYKLTPSKLNEEELPEECMKELSVYLASVEVGTKRSQVAFDITKVVEINRCDSYDKLIGATVRALQFIKNIAQSVGRTLPAISKGINLDGNLRKEAEVVWIQAIQRKYYADLFKLTASPEIKVSQAMRGFFKEHGIFLDEELNILRVTTRLQDSMHPYEAVYPILLPTKDRFTSLYIRKVHEDNGHAGIPQTLSYIRSEFWIPQGRSAVKYTLHRCNPCRKVSGPFFSMPKHPPLPVTRVKKARVFQNIGLDFCGPFTIRNANYDEWRIKAKELKNWKVKKITTRSSMKKLKPPLKPKVHKAYMLIITCAVSRAVHFEATLGMTVDDFMMGFQRFMNVRGVPEYVNSDCAKTFKRAYKELDSIYKSARVRKYFEQKRIKWSFYTERAPWMGGYIERLNSIFKSVCKKTYSKAVLSFDEFRTMVSYAMGVVNDRPLTYLYSDINSAGTEITPSMLMHGYKIMEPPHLSLRKPKDEEEEKLGERYLFLEKLKDSFWKLWSESYLTSLYERHSKQGKVPSKMRVPKENDVVLVRNENLPRRTWRLGRVLHVKKSPRDGEIREVKLLTTNHAGKRSILKRSPTFLVPLEVNQEYVKVPEDTVNKQPKDEAKTIKSKCKDQGIKQRLRVHFKP